MAYTINNYDGSLLVTIADGQIDQTTSLNLPGANTTGYGQKLNENLVYLLESFAGNTAPLGNNLQGQLWFNKSNQTLNVFTNQGYFPVSGILVSGSQPLTANPGNTWFNTGTNQYSLYDGNSWNLIGPTYTKQQGASGAFPVTVDDGDTSGVTHNIIKIQFGNFVLATLSGDSPFTPSPPMDGFLRINPGITLNSLITSPTFNSNVVGTLTGNVIGSLSGQRVAATHLVGSLIGDVTSVNGQITNLTSSNISVTGGSATGLTNFSSTNGSINTLVSGNISSSNISVTGGSATGLTNFSSTNGSAVTLVATNLSSSNILVSGGNVTGLTQLGATSAVLTRVSATTGVVTNFSSANTLIASAGITTGVVTNLSSANTLIASAGITTGVVTNLSSANAQITNSSTGTAVATNFSSGNAIIENASIGTLVAANISSANITGTFSGTLTGSMSGTAVTPATSSNSTVVATTAFVHNILPTGMIVMWGGSSANIPAGWHLCDGTFGTPDLRGQFIIGAGGSYTAGNVGGAANVTLTNTNLPSHAHGLIGTITGTTGSGGGHGHAASSSALDNGHSHAVSDPRHSHAVSDPSHAHIMPGDDQLGFAAGIAGWPGSSAAGFGYDAISNGNGGGQLWYTSSSITGISLSTAATGVTINSASTGITVSTGITAVSDHTHTISLSLGGNTGLVGNAAPVSTLPPYYALCYIQKVY